MPNYKAPVEDVTFLLNHVFQFDKHSNLPGFADAPADVREAIFAEAAKLAEEVLTPLNRTGDSEGCQRHDDGWLQRRPVSRMLTGNWARRLAGIIRFCRLRRAGFARDPHLGGQ